LVAVVSCCQSVACKLKGLASRLLSPLARHRFFFFQRKVNESIFIRTRSRRHGTRIIGSQDPKSISVFLFLTQSRSALRLAGERPTDSPIPRLVFESVGTGQDTGGPTATHGGQAGQDGPNASAGGTHQPSRPHPTGRAPDRPGPLDVNGRRIALLAGTRQAANSRFGNSTLKSQFRPRPLSSSLPSPRCALRFSPRLGFPPPPPPAQACTTPTATAAAPSGR